MKKVLEALTLFDWISPTIGIAQDVISWADGNTPIMIARKELRGINIDDAANYLREAGIPVNNIQSGTWITGAALDVPRDKWREAVKVLNQRGISCG